MKKFFWIAGAWLLLCACQSDKETIRNLEAKVDSLQLQLSKTYKPGFGEFMSGIQVHHAKLWFAGKMGNWKLADFEVHEIQEALDDLKTYQSERNESKLLYLLDPAIDSVNLAIQKQDTGSFRQSFILLTNSCNNCHKEVSYPFNNVKIPASPPFSNQEFEPHK